MLAAVGTVVRRSDTSPGLGMAPKVADHIWNQAEIAGLLD
jgi:hypothetical protein